MIDNKESDLSTPKKRNLLENIDLREKIEPRSLNQSKYLESIYNNTFTFGVGLAGTGKTLLATWAAMQALLNPKDKIQRIIVVRPVIGNKFGESFGALPGSVMEKMLPYGSSVIDNLMAFMPRKHIEAIIEQGYIEFIPLTLLRGRSLNNAFVIVEEAQNIKASGNGIYMVMSRLGRNSRMVFNGDLAQSDLNDEDSALGNAMEVLQNPDLPRGVGIVELNKKEDVQRHPLLHDIMVRFGEADGDPF